MCQLILRSCPTETNDRCGVCGRACVAPPGSQLFLAGGAEPVCHDCGRRHAPDLAALVHLARTADRVGRIGRHSVFPPLTALLELASAAERYRCAASS